jgi:hypothetical protein
MRVTLAVNYNHTWDPVAPERLIRALYSAGLQILSDEENTVTEVTTHAYRSRFGHVVR